MRTTLNIDDSLYRRVKAEAALRGCSVTSLLEEALRRALAAADASAPVLEMPVSTKSGGLSAEFAASGIDLDDTSSVLEYLEDGDR